MSRVRGSLPHVLGGRSPDAESGVGVRTSFLSRDPVESGMKRVGKKSKSTPGDGVPGGKRVGHAGCRTSESRYALPGQ